MEDKKPSKSCIGRNAANDVHAHAMGVNIINSLALTEKERECLITHNSARDIHLLFMNTVFGQQTDDDHGEQTDNDHGEQPVDDHGQQTDNDHGEQPVDDHGQQPVDDHGQQPVDDHDVSNTTQG